MGKEGTVAPKERVNIVYRASTGDAKEDVELPLKMLVLGDFTGKETGTPVEDRKSINIDKNNLNDVMKAQNITLDIQVKNKLDPRAGDEQLPVSLKFDSLKDFEPDSIAEQVPELKSLLELRDALKSLKGPLGNIPDFRKKLQALVKDEGARAKLEAELGIEGK